MDSQKTTGAWAWTNSVLVGCSTAPTSSERPRQKQMANRPMMYFIIIKVCEKNIRFKNSLRCPVPLLELSRKIEVYMAVVDFDCTIAVNNYRTQS